MVSRLGQDLGASWHSAGHDLLSLAALAGHGAVPEAKTAQAKKPAAATKAASKAPAKPKASPKQNDDPPGKGGGDSAKSNGSDVGLTVRIEVNLPPGGDAKTYDAIFASIKKHLMS